MASTSNFEAPVLMKKGKRGVAAYVHADCSNNSSPQHLNEVLDYLLNPAQNIDLWETIDWCQWIIAGGHTPDEFASIVRTYDTGTTCGLVWTPNFVAYRCRTCGISPCMSLCTNCFKKGNHQRHDFNMFLSQAGGACDCGDTSVMLETGFCNQHGPNKCANPSRKAPSDLMCVAQAMMPRIILRLIQHLRLRKSEAEILAEVEAAAAHNKLYTYVNQNAEVYITMLLDFNNMGGLMRRVMTSALTNPQMYRVLNEIPEPPELNSRSKYKEALSQPNPIPLEELKDCPSMQEVLVHKTFLEELVFWTVKYEFPQKVVCLLLNMLPDTDYKEAFTRAFVMHYSRISSMLEQSTDPDTLSNKVVHVSVQLFSNQGLALRMTEELNLLNVMVISLKHMMGKILIQNTLHDPANNFHYVVDCGKRVMKDHCYWPLVSDLNNVLSHKPIALKFMADDNLLETWFTFLLMFQGMNVNQRELNQHVEFEPNAYYAAFSAELEASAYPMWALVSHLLDSNTAVLTRRLLSACISALQEWFEAINFTTSTVDYVPQVSFHLPLHRYLAVFLCQAVAKQGISLNEILPAPDTLQLLMMHPLRIQVAFYEILNGLWVRNGLQIKGQAMTYIQCSFYNSMVDADFYLLQLCCTRVPAESFLKLVAEKFHIKPWFSTAHTIPTVDAGAIDSLTAMMEGFLTFLTTLISIRVNLGLSETGLNRLEMITLLCMGDNKTHSQLMESMPERCGTSQSRDFEALLAECANYRGPSFDSNGQLQQGMYVPKAHVWQQQYDPIHVLLRSVHRKDFQASMARYKEYAISHNKIKRDDVTPWPPFRTPSPCGPAYDDPRILLTSRFFHAIAFIVLYKSTITEDPPEQMLALIVFLLEQALEISGEETDEGKQVCTSGPPPSRQLIDMDLDNWYTTDSLSENLRTNIGLVTSIPEPKISPITPITYSSDESDSEMDTDGEADNSEINDIFMLEESERDVPGPSNQSSNMLILVPTSNRSLSTADSVQSEDDLQVRALPPSTENNPDDNNTSVAVILPPQMSLVSSSIISTISVETSQPNVQHSITYPESDASFSSGQLVRSRAVHKIPIYKRFQQLEGPHDGIKIDETIISLLLKLHSKLSGVPDSYNPAEEHREFRGNENNLGDGKFYIGRLLDKIGVFNNACNQCILETKTKLWPRKTDWEEEQRLQESREREDRRRRARERQKRLIEEFATRQRLFMESAMETEKESNMDWSASNAEDSESPKKEYDCVICNQSSPSTEDKPMGLVVLVQATSVMGHRFKSPNPERPTLPTCDEERDNLKVDESNISEFDRQSENLSRCFDPQSWLLSINIGWEGGVHVQTCGHHLHLDCLKSYLLSLHSQQRQLSLAPDRGEYLCPLCRQLANSVLPLSPQLGNCSQVALSKPPMTVVLNDLSNFLRKSETHGTSILTEAIGKTMEDITNSTHLKPMFKPKADIPSHQSLFLFVTSIARINLEVELVQRGSSLRPLPDNRVNQLLPNRDCIVPLLHVLAIHARANILNLRPDWKTFQQLCGLTEVVAMVPVEREVPLLLRDPIALLLQYVLLLPLNLEQTYFTTMVKILYNLLYYQVVAKVSCDLTGEERTKACETASQSRIDSFSAALALINQTLGNTGLYLEDDIGSASNTQVNLIALEEQIQKHCLQFLRIASLLRYHIYNQPLPVIKDTDSEFVRLVYYLELVTEGMDLDCFNSAVALNWPLDTDYQIQRATVTNWCLEFSSFISKNLFAAKSFLMDQHLIWLPPRLMQLPREYEKIFTYYHERPCNQCHSVPAETSICLLCGTIVCLKQNCCKQQNVCEAVAHANECGAGTGVFLVVTSTYIIVIRGKRACPWGSLYLDSFEEEDRDLKRGKPLYLSKDRFELLEQQWLAHRFDHTKKTWVWHRDSL